MADYFVSPGGDDANAGTQAAPWATIDKAGNTVTPGDTVRLMPGTHTGGKFYGSAANVAGPHLPLTIFFEPGAKIRGGNSRAHGLTVEGWNGVVIDGADIADLRDAPNGTGIWVAGCKNVVVRNFTISNCCDWGIHIPHCHDVLIEDGTAQRSRRQHGIYVANSASNIHIRRTNVLANNMCGIQSNGDVSIPAPDGLPTTGTIQNLLVEDCVFGFNGAAGGADWNIDAVVGGVWRRNTHLPTRGKGNAFALFHSPQNPPTADILIEDNTVVVGPARYNVVVHTPPLGAVTIRNNKLIHTGYPARSTAGLLEILGGARHVGAGFVMTGNSVNGAVVVNDSEISTLAAIGITGDNTVLTAAEVAVIVAGLPVIADPGTGTPPPPPPPPPGPVLPPVPGTSPVAHPVLSITVEEFE